MSRRSPPPTVLVLLGELGPAFAEEFATAKHFGSWLGLCPDDRITGGKVLSGKTRAVKSQVARRCGWPRKA